MKWIVDLVPCFLTLTIYFQIIIITISVNRALAVFQRKHQMEQQQLIVNAIKAGCATRRVCVSKWLNSLL